jgi:CRISPR-associated endonuclease Cas2
LRSTNPPKPETVTLEAPLPDYQPQQTELTPEQRYVAHVLIENGYNVNRDKPTVIVVHKLNRKLTFYRGLTPLKTYPVVLGNDPFNDKLYQGDACTPEGVYRVRAKYPHPKWDSFIWLDYPNTQNWLKFGRAKKAGRIPTEADIGGQVGIHGTEDPSRNLTYDVSTEDAAGRRRLRRVAQQCKNFGQRVQKSVFECQVDDMEYERLTRVLVKIIHKEEDSLRIYGCRNPWKSTCGSTVGIRKWILASHW